MSEHHHQSVVTLMSNPSEKMPGETLFGYLMLAMSLALLWQAYKISGFESLSSPGSFPMAAAAIMVVTACVVVIKDVRRKRPDHLVESFFRHVLPPLVAIMMAFILVYAVVLETVGFIPTTLGFLVLSIHVLHRRSLVFTLVISILALVVVYIIFRLVFQIILPEGIVPEREILAWIEGLFGA
jgi:putative tricarboxylic transport membrane protein